MPGLLRRAFGWRLCARAVWGVQIPRENFVGIHQAIGGLVDGLPKEGFTLRLFDSYWAKGAAIMVCQYEETRDFMFVPCINSIKALFFVANC
jgi:hypothetical protein